MVRWGIIDRPVRKSRKIHARPIPLGGGWVIYLSFFIVLGIALFSRLIVFSSINVSYLVAVWVGATAIMIGGLLDDTFQLKPYQQIIAPIIATIFLIIGGLGPTSITNPLGGSIDITQWFGLADIILFVWVMGMMFTTKFLDGLDGLVTGMVAIGAIIIYLLTLQPMWWQPEVGFLALVLAGSCLGFLVWNFFPAKIFLGEGGSLLTGYLLAIIAVISGSKIITTLLVLGVPALDVIRVITIRLIKGRSIFKGDSEHLHFKLLHAGLSQRQAVLLMYSIGLVFGFSALFLSNAHKLIAFALLGICMLILSVELTRRNQKKYGGK
jgi:UDP-GlcNAc:undecaprenyl-phosphate GlcNAc-1-phosphate transferase